MVGPLGLVKIPKFKSSIGSTNTELRPLEITQNEKVNFYRKKQMVTRYDCNGHVTSTKLETVDSNLTATLTAHYANRKKAWSYSVYNRRTKNSGGKKSKGEFTVAHSPTIFYMHVKNGINDIEYVYNKCTSIVGLNCVGEIVVEKEGMLQVDVQYSEEILPGNRDIHPTPGSCPT